MNTQINDNVWYFRQTDTIGDDDISTDSIALNVDDITGFTPQSTSLIYVWFKKSPQSSHVDSENQNGFVGLNITTNKQKEVIQALAEAASSRNKTFRTIADDVTKEYLHSNITGCSAIRQT